MDKNLNLQLRLTANGSQLQTVLNSAGSHVRAFANNTNSAVRQMTGGFQRLYQQLNGFSAISKMAAAVGGYSIVKEALDRNLEFEKTLLEMKQTAEMTTAQAAEMRRHALDTANDALAMPTEIMEGMKAFSAAGLKFDRIKPSIDEAARSAAVFRSTVAQIANLDFDLQDKMKLSPEQIKDAHNMLLYHAKSGRYEAAPMAMEAPKYLNSVASVGIGGMKGLNFTGAMTQILMKLAPATQPSEVATFMEHGIGHITSRQQVKGLAKFGIDVKKFMPNGKFYGDGGVQGIMDLAAAMKSAGLDNPFKLDQAGFREMYTKKFWKQLMSYQDQIKKAMAEGDRAAMDDMVGRDKAEIMRSNYAKFKQLQITKERGQLSDSSTDVVSKLAGLEGWAAENPKTAIAGGAAAAIAGRLLWKRLTGGGGGAGNALSTIASGAKGGMPVMVTNWPASLGGGMKASERLASLPGRGTGAATGTAAGAAGGTVASAAVGAVAVAAPLAVAYAANKYFSSDTGQKRRADGLNLEIQRLESRLNLQKSGGYQDKDAISKLEKQIAQMKQDRDAILSRLEAVANRPVQVNIDGRAVAETVNQINGRTASRQ
ncbi:hypothetical protein EDC30_102216 [Paucimonas lemoignei]|uniref:TP901 family phage tail tape measure protein n=1 Tax=Paucimonas lemoignei TaxID=29443 RepID=A0A4R3HYN0_PAULE|nr:hypothetical protein [Paucimonas lemoignei]TCS38477.1 hypothetical protein EDC30_102216 [Paucimonas lemoignei]